MDALPPQSDAEEAKPAALQLELPSAPTHARAAVAAAERSGRALVGPVERRIASWLVGAVLLVASGIAVVELALPRYVRRACIEEAMAHGIALTIDDAKVTRSGFVLVGVKAQATEVPGASAEAAEVQIETKDLHPQKLTASGMLISLEGRWSDVAASFTRWRASEHGGQGGAWAPVSIVMDGSRIVWRGPIGENARVEATGVHFDAAWPDREPAIHATSSHVTTAVPGATLGPWRVDLDREPGASRVRVALDPDVPDACTLLAVGDGETVTTVDVVIPRSPVARLGIPQAALGLHGNLQLESLIHYAVSGTRATGVAKGGLYGATVQGMSRPLDLAWDVSANGRDGEIDLRDARVAVGPLVGAALGTLKTFDDGFRLDLAWHADPCPARHSTLPSGPASRSTSRTRSASSPRARGSRG